MPEIALAETIEFFQERKFLVQKTRSFALKYRNGGQILFALLVSKKGIDNLPDEFSRR